MIAIKTAHLDDIPAITLVLRETWRDTYAIFLPEEVIATASATWHTPERLAAEIEDPAIYFAVASDAEYGIVGLISARLLDSKILLVTRLYVLPDNQRQGIGGRLLAFTVDHHPVIDRIRLDVDAENQKGLAFYRCQGFVEIRRVEEMVGAYSVNVVMMEKQIP